MLFYVKDRKTFKTKAVLEGVSWKLVRSVWTDLSEITAKDDPNVSAGDFVYNTDGWIGLISGLERDNNQISLKAEKVENLFGRTVMWDDISGYINVEADCDYLLMTFIDYVMMGGTGRSGEMDSMYGQFYSHVNITPYVAVGYGSCVPVLQNGLINVKSYVSQCRRLKSVFTNCTIEGNTFHINIVQDNRQQKTLITTNFPCVVKEESFSETKIAKITTYKLTGKPLPEYDNEPFYDNVQQWYLLKDGSVSSNKLDPNRAEGEWKMIEITEEGDDPETVAQNEFAKNTYSHKLIIQMQEKDARFDFYDRVNVEINNKIYESYVSRKTITSDGLVEYTFGDLKTSLMDKINEYD